jgi:type IV pilus assembly protein PilB
MGDAELNKSGGEIAALLVKEKCLSDEQLAYAIRVKSKLSTSKTLIDIIIELGLVSNDQLRQVLRNNQVNIRIGDLLVELGYLREDELKAALHIQQEGPERKKLGDVLVEHSFIDERKFVETLAYQLGFPLLELEFNTIDRQIFSKVPFNVCQSNFFIPVKRQDDLVLVAFADPLDPHCLATAERYLGRAIESGIATKTSIAEALVSMQKSGQADLDFADENTIIGMINSLFESAIEEGASDIHIEPMKDRLRIRFRRDGVMMLHRDLAKEIAPQLTSRIKVLAQADIAEKRRHQDGRILFDSRKHGFGLDMRVSFFITIHGEKIVLRLLNKKGAILDIHNIGMAPRMLERFIYDALDTPTGVMIVTGPTGSGKTSTLYSCVNYLNNTSTSIITAEDPVEFVIEGISQCSINPKIGVTFEETLRHIVRQDPDVIVLGEIRDTFSAETAIQAALTGHKVLTTFHTEDSIGGLIRLMNMEIEAFLISSTVVCVLAQRLLRLICSECAESYVPTPVEFSRLGLSPEQLHGATFRSGRGCKACHFSGFRGRMAVFELLVLNEMVKEAILTHRSSHEIRRISTETSGLVTLFEDGLVKAAKGLISIQEVLRDLPRITKPRSLHELKRVLGEQ